MSIWRLVLREIRYRKLSFGLSVLSVIVAVGCLVAQLLLLRQHDLRAEQILAAKETETKEVMAKLEDDYRKITVNLGFNIRILPKDLNLLDFYAKDYADRYMPEDYAEKLSKVKVITVNHVLPTLQQRLQWPEQELTILLVGTRGEIPLAYQSKKKAILDAVPRGKVVVGYQLHRALSRTQKQEVKVGDKLTLKRKEYTVHKLHPPRGDRDDITLWVHLADAQEMLGKEGQINGILALGCNCSADRLGVVREEIAGILPDTQVEEFETKATVRAEARNRAAAEAKAGLEREQLHQARVREEKTRFAALLVPLVLLAATVWLGVLALNNVRERRPEIGLLRAVGVRSAPVFLLFLGRAILVGLLGAVAGLAVGIAVAAESPSTGVVWPPPVDAELIVLALVVAPAWCAVACWLPALLATRQDPAVILQQE